MIDSSILLRITVHFLQGRFNILFNMNPILQDLARDANTYDEWATKRFWMYVLDKLVFTSPNWMVSSEQPPTRMHGNLRRVDLIVERLDEDITILFLEAKKHNAEVNDVADVEHQAFTACTEYLLNNNRRTVWAMTCVGTKARFWAQSLDTDYLTPVLPTDPHLGNIQSYIDYTRNRAEIHSQLEYIKENRIPPRSTFLPVILTRDCTGVQIEGVSRREEGMYRCRSFNGNKVNLPMQGWIECVLQEGRQKMEGYYLTTESETYCTVSLTY